MIPTMNQRRKFEGQWFIFGDDQPATLGTLTFEPESGSTLEMQWDRSLNVDRLFVHFKPPTTVHAIDGNGTQLSLFGCQAVQWGSTATLNNARINVLHIFTGGHFAHFRNTVFNTVHVTYSLLDFWLFRSALICDVSDTSLSRFSQRAPPDIRVKLPNDVIQTITMSIIGEHKVFPPSVKLTQKQFVQFEFPNPILTTEIRSNFIDVFGRLLSFLTGVEVFADSIKFPQNRVQFREVEWLHASPRITSATREHIHRPMVAYEESRGGVTPHSERPAHRIAYLEK